MALEEHKMNEAGRANVSAAVGGVAVVSQNMQAIASELTRMSLESFENAAQVADRFSKAKSWDQIIDIQKNFLKSSIDSFATHGTKVAELMTAWPSEMDRTYRRVSESMTEAGNAAMKSMADQTSVTAEKMTV